GAAIVSHFNPPVWVPDKSSFEWAQDLKPGEHLLLANGRTPAISSISQQDEGTTVYNLSISEIHTFFVGPDSALVHNVCALTDGGRVPNAGGVIRSFVTSTDQTFYRVYSGTNTVGGFLTAVRPGSSAFAREALAL